MKAANIAAITKPLIKIFNLGFVCMIFWSPPSMSIIRISRITHHARAARHVKRLVKKKEALGGPVSGGGGDQKIMHTKPRLKILMSGFVMTAIIHLCTASRT